MKNRLLTSFMLFMICYFMTSAYSQSQSIKRQSINSYGSSTNSGGLIVKQTVGQPYQTQVSQEDGVKIRPGFQQASQIKIIKEPVSQQLSLGIEIFPNPASLSINMVSESQLDNLTLQVSDIRGKVILQKSYSSFLKEDLDCSQWSSGIYFLQISSANDLHYSSKLIIEN